MKKLLSILTVSAFIASSATNTIACGDKTKSPLKWQQYILPKLQEAQISFPPRQN